jgi:hypothetical protein
MLADRLFRDVGLAGILRSGRHANAPGVWSTLRRVPDGVIGLWAILSKKAETYQLLMKRFLARITGLGLLFAIGQPSLLACTACFGQSDSRLAQGMNMGIFALLLVITAVLFCVAGFFVYLARRGAQLEHSRQQLAGNLSEIESTLNQP